MKKKLLLYAFIGFLIGMVMVVLIPTIFNRADDGTARLCSPALIARTGSPKAALSVSLLLYGLFGACCISGMLLYQIERWPLALATAAHYLIVVLGYALSARLLCWGLTRKELLVIEGLMTCGFILIWLILYFGYRGKTRELNKLMEKNKREKEQK